METTSLRFAEAVRTLAGATRQAGLVAPAFRSPPRISASRSIRRRPDGGATVAVRYRDRPWPAILADLVEGVVATNQLTGVEADDTRSTLWNALERDGLCAESDAVISPWPLRAIDPGVVLGEVA